MDAWRMITDRLVKVRAAVAELREMDDADEQCPEFRLVKHRLGRCAKVHLQISLVDLEKHVSRLELQSSKYFATIDARMKQQKKIWEACKEMMETAKTVLPYHNTFPPILGRSMSHSSREFKLVCSKKLVAKAAIGVVQNLILERGSKEDNVEASEADSKWSWKLFAIACAIQEKLQTEQDDLNRMVFHEIYATMGLS